MNTVSVEIARKLKDAGLVWEPKFGDYFLRDDSITRTVQYIPENGEKYLPICLWLPTLNDLLVWLEGWRFPRISLEYGEKAWALSLWKSDIECVGMFEDVAAVEAVALAVLWALEQEV